MWVSYVKDEELGKTGYIGEGYSIVLDSER